MRGQWPQGDQLESYCSMVAWIRMIVMEVVRSGQIHGRGRADSFAVVRCDRKGSIRNDFRFSAEHVHWWTLR